MNISWIRRLAAYLLGLFIMTLGIAVAIKSSLGAAPVSSIPHTLQLCFGINIDIGTVLFHTFLVLLQIIILNKNFKFKNLLQIAAGIVFGYFTALCCSLVDGIRIESYSIRLLMILLSAMLIALGIFFYLPADIVPLAAEGLNKAISDKSGVPFNRVKIVFDVIVVLISLVLSVSFLDIRFEGMWWLQGIGSVGIGTVIDAVLVGVILGFFNRHCKFIVDRLLGHPV